MRFVVKAIPLFKDNYSYFIRLANSKVGVLVDPADPPSVLGMVAKEHVGGVIYTHKHWDHAGQSQLLRQQLPQVPFIAGSPDSHLIPGITQSVQSDRLVQICGLRFKVFKTPCHTSGHICFTFGTEAEFQPLQTLEPLTFQCSVGVFTGDTLFLSGAGKFFEGNEHDMYSSLAKLKQQVPAQASVFPGHQYTVSNLKWAMSVKSEVGSQIQRLFEEYSKLQCTIPGEMRRQLQVNLFLRATSPEQLRAVRQNKNNFKDR